MKLIYAPAEGEGDEWEFDQAKLKVGEVKLIEQTTDQTLQEFFETLSRGSFTNLLTLFWVMRRRRDSEAMLSDFDDADISELIFEDDAEESVEQEAPKAPEPQPESSSDPQS